MKSRRLRSPRRSCSPERVRHPAARGRAHARPGSPPSRSRTAAAISRAISTPEPRRFTLNAISGRRAPTSTPSGRLVETRGPEAGLDLAGGEPAGELLGPAAPEEGRSATLAELAVQEDGQAELLRRSARRAPGLPPAPPASAPAAAGTSGTTSAAPIRGCAPSWRRRSMRSTRAGDAGQERVDELRRPADEREDRAVVIGVGVHVEQLAPARRARPRWRRSSPGRGPPRSSAPTRAGAPPGVL